MSVNRVHHPDLSLFQPGGIVTIEGDDAHHLIRVRRLEAGAPVTVLDGLGRVAEGKVAATRKHGRDGWALDVAIATIATEPRVSPGVHVLSSAPKGDRLGTMIDGLSQVGAASWAPLDTVRTVVEPGAGKIDRLERIAAESAKQCGRAWKLEIAPGLRFAQALEHPHVVIADGEGEAYRARGAETIRLLVGPEGGFSPEEVSQARAAGARVCRFGPHIMRIETAAVVAAAMIVSEEAPRRE
jgi:16S rRNA (uracil1498-N3)-methyltransferase